MKRNRDPPSHSKILDISEAYYAQRESYNKILVDQQDSQDYSKIQEDKELSIVLKN
jgi:hypothetical protein